MGKITLQRTQLFDVWRMCKHSTDEARCDRLPLVQVRDSTISHFNPQYWPTSTNARACSAA